jgi:hypothetical protein
MTTPTRLQDRERTHPLTPPPTKKNDAHVRKTTQIGTVMTSAVRATASPPSTPTLSVNADRESILSNGEATLFLGRYRPLVVLVKPAEGDLCAIWGAERDERTKRTRIGRVSPSWEDGTRVAMDHSW